MNLDQFINYANNSNSFYDYVQQLRENGFRYSDELINGLSVARHNRDAFLLEDIIGISLRDGADNRFTNILTELIKEDWHDRHHDIVTLFRKIKDPLSVDIIFETAINIADWDDRRGLARNCIWALGEINTQEAFEKLKLLATGDDRIIKEVASMELNQLKNIN